MQSVRWGDLSTTTKPVVRACATQNTPPKFASDSVPPRAAHDMTAAPADRATGPKRGSPFYWVAFVLSGDWR